MGETGWAVDSRESNMQAHATFMHVSMPGGCGHRAFARKTASALSPGILQEREGADWYQLVSEEQAGRLGASGMSEAGPQRVWREGVKRLMVLVA